MANLCMSWDHRALDGVEAARFLGAVKARLEEDCPMTEHEELVVRRGSRSGATIAVAIHSTALGPALGGARMWRYGDPDEAVADVLRLARGMTLKAAAAGLDLGGGKGVICLPDGEAAENPSRRRDMLLDFADLVESLGGRYVTAEDVGTGSADMTTISTRTRHVVGLPSEAGGVGDPSPFTAAGVYAAMRACAERRFGTSDLRGLGVVVIGLGHVGARLARAARRRRRPAHGDRRRSGQARARPQARRGVGRARRRGHGEL